MGTKYTKLSKHLSYILRHRPDVIGLELDSQGWATIDDLVEKVTKFNLTNDLLRVVVETNDKQRYRISDDGKRIKANQGHSIDIDLDLEPVQPPHVLYHGTADRFMDTIKADGLTKQNRHHVHLSESEPVAMTVGGRHGRPVIIIISARKMYEDGFQFYKTANNVWLVDHVPPEYMDAGR